MMGLFKFAAEAWDHGLDRILEGPAGEWFGKNMGAIGAVVAASFLVMGMAVATITTGRTITSPQYFAILPGKPPARLPVLSSPALSVEKITLWSSRAVRDIFRFNFRDVDQRLARNAIYFTPAAQADFLRSMEASGMIEQVKEQRQFVVLTPMEEAQLISSAMVNGQRVLRVEIPVIITYIAGDKPVYRKHFLELFILPVPTTDAPEGLAIAKLRAHPYR